MNILKVPEILIPNGSVDLKKWAVIACDQFTGDKKYWEELDGFCGDVSTLRIIYPEIYLNDRREERIREINATMRKYLDGGIFDAYKGFILTVRKTAYGNVRLGLIVSFDLEEYEIGGERAVRATEATVRERLPVRISIRENAPIELPHALLLVDDREKRIIEPIYESRAKLKKLYETELNMDGGSLEGYLVENADEVMRIIEEVTDLEASRKKYGVDKPFAFAVGDGNHSIATARECWDKIKAGLSPEERENHPARYCLVELNNIYDDNLKFEPIHRVVYGAKDDFLEKLESRLNGGAELTVVAGGKEFTLGVSENSAKAIADVQAAIDEYLDEHVDASQDYVHGDDAALREARCGAAAILMPKLKKEDLFAYVAKHGPLTRKSFSMGEAREKRYYFECKKIR